MKWEARCWIRVAQLKIVAALLQHLATISSRVPRSCFNADLAHQKRERQGPRGRKGGRGGRGEEWGQKNMEKAQKLYLLTLKSCCKEPNIPEQVQPYSSLSHAGICCLSAQVAHHELPTFKEEDHT